MRAQAGRGSSDSRRKNKLPTDVKRSVNPKRQGRTPADAQKRKKK